MPLVSTELDSAYYEPIANGPRALCDLSAYAPIQPSGTIAASGNFTSPVLNGDGFLYMACSLKSTQAGAINIQRYLDAAGTIPQGAAVTVALTANTQTLLNVDDGLIYRTFTLQITNTGGSAATVSSFAFLMGA
jgi:hypothetical protein